MGIEIRGKEGLTAVLWGERGAGRRENMAGDAKEAGSANLVPAFQGQGNEKSGSLLGSGCGGEMDVETREEKRVWG